MSSRYCPMAFLNMLFINSVICIFACGCSAITALRNSTSDLQNKVERNNPSLEWPLVALALTWWHLYQRKQDRLEGVQLKEPKRQIFPLWNGLGYWEDLGLPGRNHSEVNYILRRELGPSAEQHITSVESWKADCEGLLKAVLPKC